MTSPIVKHIQSSLSPNAKTLAAVKLTSFVTKKLQNKEYKNEHHLTVTNSNNQCITPVKCSNATPSTSFKVQTKLFDEEVQKKLNYDINDENIYSIDTPKQKRWLHKGIEDLPNWHFLGKGSFGTVVKAKYKGNDLAVKVIAKSYEHISKTLENEQNGKKLDHSNIIKIMQVIDQGEKYGLVLMEQWCAPDLQQLIIDGAFSSIQQKLRILESVAEALQYCHGKGILHLDVKPKNILVRLSNGTCKLCDFGNSLDTNVNSVFCLNDHKGTIQYMSPELLQGKNASVKCDVYSLGITMWQLMHEEVPYFGENIHIIAYKVVSQSYRPQSTKVLHSELTQLYEGCWHRNPSMRPTVSTFLYKLKQNQFQDI